MSEIESLSKPFYYIITTKPISKILITEKDFLHGNNHITLYTDYSHRVVLNIISKSIGKVTEDDLIEVDLGSNICYAVIDNDVFNDKIDENDIKPYSNLIPNEIKIFEKVYKLIGTKRLEKLKKEKKRYDSIVENSINHEIDDLYKKIVISISEKVEKKNDNSLFENRNKAIKSIVDISNCMTNEIIDLRSKMNQHILSILKSWDKDKIINELQEENEKLNRRILHLESENENLKGFIRNHLDEY